MEDQINKLKPFLKSSQSKYLKWHNSKTQNKYIFIGLITFFILLVGKSLLFGGNKIVEQEWIEKNKQCLSDPTSKGLYPKSNKALKSFCSCQSGGLMKLERGSEIGIANKSIASITTLVNFCMDKTDKEFGINK